MNEPTREAIQRSIGLLRRRWFTVRVLRYGARALFYALIAAALVLWLVPAAGWLNLALGALGVSIVAAIATAVLQRPSEVALAKAYDDCVDLKDRISSSVELLAEDGPRGPMVEALLEDAGAAAGRVAPARVYPISMPREGWLLPLPALLVLAVLLLPDATRAGPQLDPLVEQTLDERVKELEEMLSHEHDKEPTPRRKELIAELQKLKTELKREDVDKKDAMAEIAKLLDKLDKEREADERKKRDLKELMQSMQMGEQNKQLADMLQNGEYQEALNKLKELSDELKKKLEEMRKKNASPEELEKLEEQLKKMKELEAKLLNLLQIDMDLAMMGAAIDFLSDFEGDLANITDMLKGLPLLELDCKCDKPGL